MVALKFKNITAKTSLRRNCTIAITIRLYCAAVCVQSRITLKCFTLFSRGFFIDYKMNKLSLGIDIGTRYSCGYAYDGKNFSVICNPDGGRTTPSVVAYKDVEGRLLLGNSLYVNLLVIQKM